jgi:hypothetical protein
MICREVTPPETVAGSRSATLCRGADGSPCRQHGDVRGQAGDRAWAQQRRRRVVLERSSVDSVIVSVQHRRGCITVVSCWFQIKR